MKLRFEKNSIRYRIRKSELEQLKQEGIVKDIVAFPRATLIYELRVADMAEVTPELLDNNIAIYIPTAIANNWTDTEEVGIYATVNFDGNQQLDIIIEKDFPCKDRPEEDRSDTFTELVDKEEDGKVC